MKTEFKKTDYRKFDIKYKGGLLSPLYSVVFTQLELLKCYNALVRVNNKQISMKIKKLIEYIDKNENEIESTDFERILPRKSNARRIREWESLEVYKNKS